jgi:hypothetical protein
MKTIFTILTALMFTTGVYSQEFYTSSNSKEKSEQESPINEIVDLINKSLEKAQGSLSDIKIQEAEISLKTSYTKNGGGGFKIFLKASKKWEVENANTFTFTFDKVSTPKEGLEKSGKQDYLTTALIDAAQQWKTLNNTISGLKKKNLSVEVSFTITKTSEGGIEFELIGVGVDVSGKLENSAVHTIKLTFI